MALAEEDEIDDDDSATIEAEGGAKEDLMAGADPDADGDGDGDGEKKNVSPDADTHLLFTRPSVKASSVELPAGNIVEFLVGELLALPFPRVLLPFISLMY